MFAKISTNSFPINTTATSITLAGAGKRFNNEWIFRACDHVFETGKPTVILGSNGSGKSTLLQLLSGISMPSEGGVSFAHQGQAVAAENVFRHVSLAAPYLELFEELTLQESLRFHAQFKPFRNKLSGADVTEQLQLPGKIATKPLKYYSSGMKQRVKLALAILSDTPILLLDEPLSNLDRQGMDWYRELVATHTKNRLSVVCSNLQEDEYFFCTEQLLIEDFKR